MLTTADKVGFPHCREWIALALAVLPLGLNLYSISTVNGRITSYTDFLDVILGAALAVLTFRNMVFINEGEARFKSIRIALTVVLFIAAAFHVASGLGLLVTLPYPLGYGLS